MKMRLSGVIACFVLSAILCGCAVRASDGAASPVRIAALTGPTAIAMAGFFRDAAGDSSVAGRSFRLCGSADELVPLILQGEVDIASLPLNLASVLYNRTGGEVTLLAADVLGVLYIAEYGSDTLRSISDLRGQTLYASGKGSVPEYYLRYILQNSGLDPDRDLTVEWRSEPGEIVALLNAKGSGLAMLPQPYLSAARAQLGEEFRIQISLTEEWDALEPSRQCITAGVLVRNDFLSAYPEEVSSFLTDLAGSVSWVGSRPADAAALCESAGIGKASILEQAIPRCNLVCITGEELVHSGSGCLEVLYGFDPSSIGGALPAEDFFYVEKTKQN